MKKNQTIKSIHHTFIFLILLGLLSNALAMSLPPLQVSVDTNKINSYAEYTITFDRSQITSPDTDSPYMFELIHSDTNITVIFPPEIDTTSSTSPSCNADQLTCSACTFSGNLLTVQNCFLSTNNVTSVILKISNIKNPSYTLTTSQFSGAIGSQSTSSGSTITFSPTSLSVDVILESLYVGMITKYQFSIAIPDAISSDGIIKITFPSTISIGGSSACTALGSSVYSTPTCFNSGNIISISNLNTSSSNFAAGTTFAINITSITNPPSTEPAILTISSYYDSNVNNMVSTQTATITAIQALLVSSLASVTSSDYTVSTTSVTYTFTFTTTNTIPINGYVVLGIPQDITTLTSSVGSSCYKKLNGDSTYIITGCTVTNSINYNLITFTNLFPLSSYSQNQIINLKIQNSFTNPSLAVTITTFKIQTYDAGNYMIDKLSSGLTMEFVCASNSISIMNICTACVAPCLTCSARTSTCTSCIPSVSSPVFLTSSNICVTSSSCPSTYYGNTTNYQCVSCVPPCKTCSSQTICLSCISGYQLSGSTCIQTNSCPNGQISINLVCTNCDPSCYTCEITITNCTSCDSSVTPNLYLSGNTCVTVCPSSTYNQFISQQCKPCISPCQTCSNLTHCLTCVANYSMSAINSGICLVSCPAGFICTECISPCLTCQSTNCLSCIDGYALSGTTCLSLTVYCPIGRTYINEVCTYCDPNCRTCEITITNCTSCYGYLLGNKCVQNCPSNYFINWSILYYQCKPCALACQICDQWDHGYCSKCITGYKMSTINYGVCIVQCPTGYICTGCVSPCLTCQSINTTCTSCISGYQLLGTTCIQTNSCPTGQISINLVCTNCDSTCHTCSIALTNCTSCDSSIALYLSGNACVTVCPSYTYTDISSAQCKLCVSPCQTCSSATFCLTCITGYNMLINSGICLVSCPFKYTTIQNACIKCASPCLTCQSTDSTCKSCIIGYELSGNTCVQTSTYCPNGQISINLVCTNCDPSCYTCEITITNCTSCDSSVTPNLYLSGNTCVTVCPSSTYNQFISQQCKPCISPCQTCSNLTHCLTCVANYSMSAINSGICLVSCPAGFICTECISPCLTCQSTNCLSCIDGYALSGTTCLSLTVYCPIGRTYINEVCTYCDPNCRTCEITITNCTSCYGYLLGNKCVQNCPSNYFINWSILYYQCKPCALACQICDQWDHGYCSKCITGYKMSTINYGVCIVQCPTGYICTGCVSPCLTCQSINTTCTSCISGYQLLGTTCIETNSCSTGQIPINLVCTNCDPTCHTCSIALTNCTSCDSSIALYLSGNACVTVCPSYTYTDISSAQCKLCVSPCQTCSSATFCLTCITDYNMLINSGICLVSCPFKYTTIQNACIKCASPCLTCQSTDSTCKSCIIGYEFSGNNCVQTSTYCPNGQIYINLVCTNCDPSCYTCEITITNCTSCDSSVTPNLYLSGNTCVTVCPSSTYNQFISQQCKPCISPCQTCSNLTHCLTCVANYSMSAINSGICLVSCPAGFICTECISPCLTCQSTNCLSCIDGYALSGTTCLSLTVYCPIGRTYINEVCTYCDPNCRTCEITITNCTSCYGYLLGNKCVQNCPSNYFINWSILYYQCKPCALACQICDQWDHGYCSKCITGYKMSTINYGVCIVQCPTGYICAECVQPCYSCEITNATICTSCFSGYQLQGTTCIKTNPCPTGQIPINQVCTSCDTTCYTCSIALTNCTSCSTVDTVHSYLFNSKCVTTCPTTYYENVTSYQCVPCVQPCVTCTSQTMCLSCVSGFQLSGTSCISICPTGQIQINQICTSCDTTCYTCSYIETNCTSCDPSTNLYLSGSTCVSICPSSTYADATSMKCKPCVSPCQTCSSITNCLTCIASYSMSATNSGVCLSSCPSGYISIAKLCTACVSLCLTCSATTSTCTSCMPSVTSPVFLTGSNTCVQSSDCPSTYYGNSTNYQCVSCILPCVTCLSSIICLTCINEYQISGTTCIQTSTQCQIGQIFINLVCINCDPSCYTCNGVITNCTSCNPSVVPNIYLSNNACVTVCPTYTYADNTSNQCKQCISPCQTCSNLTHCLTCVANYSMSAINSGICLVSCPAGFICTECISPCLTCQSTNCLSCIDGYALSGTTCLSLTVYCPIGRTIINEVCTYCDPNCRTCEITITNCTSCYRYLLGNKCVQNCPSNYFIDSSILYQQCKPCALACQICYQWDYGYCSKCIDGYKMSTINYGVCIVQCPTGYICRGCVSPCLTCQSINSTCTSCISGYQLLGTTCIETNSCPTGQIPINLVCTNCDSTCHTCSIALTNCTSCDSSIALYLSGNACVTVCPSYTYTDISSAQCKLCVSPCQTCSSATFCLTCITGYNMLINSGICLVSCPFKYTTIQNACIKCASPCLTCQSTDSTCKSCIIGYEFSGNNCVQTSTYCPNGQIFINQVCTNCDPSCYTCEITITNCTSCDSSVTPNIYLSNNACVTVCPSSTYNQFISQQCKPCISPCQTCSNLTHCLTCVANYSMSAINSGICLVSCPAGFICTECISPCLTCQSTNCLSCIDGYALSGTTCLSLTVYCPIGRTIINEVCTYCDPNCRTCEITITNCTSCYRYLLGNKCVQNCPSNYFIDSSILYQQCKPCALACQICYQWDYGYCSKCIDGYKMSTINYGVCIVQCPTGYICRGCVSPCLTCQSINSTCTSCISGYQLLGTTCIETNSCPTGQIPINLVCTNCDPTCHTCSIALTNCTSCDSSIALYLSGNTCVTVCPSYTYSDISSAQCKLCVSPCQTCSSATFCLTCITGYNMLINSGICLVSCPFKYTTIQNACIKCASPCLTCQSTDSTCKSCIIGYEFSGNNCVQTSTYCPNGQIFINQVCTNCDPSCYTCEITITNCTSCDSSVTPNIYLSNNACVTVCPSSTYNQFISQQCKPCISPCQTCSNLTHCLTCVANYSMSAINSGICLVSCPAGFICTECISPCLTCQSTNCLSCIDGYALSGTTCLSLTVYCPIGRTIINEVCTYCDPNCRTCEITITNCTSCYRYLLGNKCVQNCPSNYFIDSSILYQQCKPCALACQICYQWDHGYCSKCIAGYKMSTIYYGVCIVQCPTGYICAECVQPCYSCEITNATICTSCFSGYQLQGTTCIKINPCPTGQIPINQVCTSCDTTCYTCSIALTNCTSCSTVDTVHSYLFNSTCVTICPFPYYGNTINYQCVLCVQPCVTCTSQTMCLSCVSGFQLSGTSCISICPTGQIQINEICTSCDTTCYTCSYIETNCTSCDPSINLYLSGSTCISICPSSTYADPTSMVCKPCVSPCYTCSSITNCLTCIASYSMSATNSGVCLSSCPSGYISIAKLCTACVQPCLTCSTTTSTCTSCMPSATSPVFLTGSNTCVQSSDCPSTYYGNSTNYQCVSCILPCVTCLSSIICLTCINEYQISGTTCIQTSTQCQIGQIFINLACINCDPSCYTCNGVITNCTSCNPSVVPNIYLSNNACVTVCPTYTYADNTSTQCKQCISPCQTCSNLTHCLTCVANYSMSAINSGICLVSCPAGYLSVFSICQPCNSPCATCTTTVNICTSCLSSITPSVFLTNSQCVTASNCPSGFYGNTTTNQCTACVATCLTCTSFSACLSCPDPYSLYSSNCILTCPIGYLSVSFICQPCTSPCATCSGTLTSCLSCLTTITPAVFLTGTSCVIASNCPSGTYANTTINQCASCISPCSTCTNFSSCLSCIGGQPPVFLTGNSCVTQTQCPLGYYANFTNNLCTQCIPSCSQCNNSNICLLCDTGYSLQSATNTCVTSCLYNQISINSICTTCSSPCLTCAYSTMNCTSCQSNLSPAVFLYLYSCVSICPDYTYPNITTNQCQPCVSPCATCTTSSLCLSCLTGYALYSNNCLSTCPQGTTSVNQVCMNCSSSCLTCINTTTTCLSCALGYYLVPSSYTCVSSCPANLFVNSLTQTCVGCDDACSTCSNYPTNCTACNTGILYNLSPNFTCVENCPAQYYNLTNICTACPTGCVTCTSSASCQSCISGYYLYIESCLLSCPATTQIIVNDICKNCSTANCQNCTPNDYCYKCYSPYYILNGTCYSTCPPSFVAQSQTCYFQPETTYSVYPMPFSIATVIIIILCLLLRSNDINFFFSSAIYSITSIPETLVNLYFVYLYYIYTNQNFKDRLFLCIACSFAWLFFINILLFIVFNMHYLKDKAFKKWLKQRSKITYCLVIILCLFVNHKIINLIFSRMLRFDIFSARLENIKKFFWIHFMWFLSSIHTISGIGLCSYNLYINGSIRDQLYFESIDLMVVLILNSIFGILNLYKDQDYFKHKKLVNEQEGADFESSNSEQIFIYDKISQSYKPMYMKMDDLNNGNNEQVFIYDKNLKQYRLINSSDLNNGGQFVVNFKSSKPMNINNLNKSQFINSPNQNIFAYDRQSKSYKLLNVTNLNSSQSELMYVYDRNSNSYRPTMMSQDKLNEQSINSPTHKMDDSPSKLNKNTIMNINQIDQVEDQQYPSNVEKQVDKNKKNPRKKALLQVKVNELQNVSEQIYDQVQIQQNKQKQLIEEANTFLTSKKRNMKQKKKKMTNYYYQEQNQSKVDPQEQLKIKKTSEEQPIILAKIRPVDNPVQLDQQKKVEKNPYLEQLIDFNQQEQNLQKSPEEEYIKQNPSTIRKRAARKKKFMQQKDNPYDYQNSSNNPAEQKQQSSKIQQRLRSQNEKNLFKK